jgi:Tfp pilus assembly protein PilN
VFTKLNLSTHPFRNRTTPYIIAALLLFVAAIGTLLCISQLRSNAIDKEIVEKQRKEFDEDVKRFIGEGEKVQQQLTPEQRSLLTAAHKLVANKDFGWSRLFADLEGVMPGSVSASRIAVKNVYRDGDRVKAELDFAVLSRDYQAVMGMIGTMNNSGVFQAELRTQSLQQNERVTFTEYTLSMIYTPPYGVSTASGPDVAMNPDVQGGGSQ